MPIIEGTSTLKSAEAEYDFAVDGGAVGAITLRGVGPLGNVIPKGSFIVSGYVEVLTPFTTSASGTGALKIEGADDLIAATIVSGAPWSTTGRKSIIPAGTGATSVKTTAERNLVFTIATGAITAGKFRAVVFYR